MVIKSVSCGVGLFTSNFVDSASKRPISRNAKEPASILRPHWLSADGVSGTQPKRQTHNTLCVCWLYPKLVGLVIVVIVVYQSFFREMITPYTLQICRRVFLCPVPDIPSAGTTQSLSVVRGGKLVQVGETRPKKVNSVELLPVLMFAVVDGQDAISKGLTASTNRNLVLCCFGKAFFSSFINILDPSSLRIVCCAERCTWQLNRAA